MKSRSVQTLKTHSSLILLLGIMAQATDTMTGEIMGTALVVLAILVGFL